MRLLLVEDQRMLADALSRAIRSAGEDVVSVVGTVDEVVEVAHRLDPDIVLVDVGRRHEDGVDVGRRIAQDPDIRSRVVGLASDCWPALVGTVTQAGFRGLVTRGTVIGELLEDLRAVVAESSFVQRPNANGRAHSDLAAASAAGMDALTPRELDVLRLLTAAATTDEIARRLGISTHTVRAHVQAVLTKLQVHSRLEAAAIGMRLGISATDGNGRGSNHGPTSRTRYDIYDA
jgi:two-component system nitrate/nitrite response regulator NarL